MTSVRPLVLLSLGLLLTAGTVRMPAATPVQDRLAQARLLYASAAYEEALALLPEMPADVEANEVDRYKALCLLALDRTVDAEEALSRIITRDPRFQIRADDSPRIVALFRDLRRRILPGRAESLYARAKADFEDRRYREAIGHFTQAIDIMGDPDVGSATHVQELRKIAEEYRSLAEERLPEEPASSPVGASASEAAPPARPGSDEAIYTMLSADVKPPVEVIRRMPPWNPPADQAWRTFRGVIEVLVSRTGEVEDVRLLERIAPFYDEALAQAAWTWTFEPARLGDQPVRFRHRIQIVMRPR
jgi:tetratricopeptide (TPR) repeat protein